MNKLSSLDECEDVDSTSVRTMYIDVYKAGFLIFYTCLQSCVGNLIIARLVEGTEVKPYF